MRAEIKESSNRMREQKTWQMKPKISLEGLTKRVTDSEDRIKKLEDEVQKTSK